MENEARRELSQANSITDDTKKFERRAYQATRDAIENIQESLFDPDASDTIFARLIKHLVLISDCKYGVCYLSGENAEFPILTGADLLPLYHDSKKDFINKKVLSAWVGQKSVLTSPVYYNSPIPKATKTLLIDPDNISSLMLLPILVHKELRAICILGDKDKQFSSTILSKIRPVLDAVVCTLQSAETVRGNFSGLNQDLAHNRYLSSLISSSPIGVLVIDSNSTIVLSNPAAQDIFDPDAIKMDHSSQLSLAGTNIHKFFPCYEAFFQWSNQHDKTNLEDDTHGPRIWEYQTAHKMDGTTCTVNLTLFRYNQGLQRYTTMQIQDITLFQAKSDEYKSTSQQLNALTQLAPVGIIRVSVDWNCIFSNEKWCEFTGLSHEESTGREWINAIHPSDVSELLMSIRNALQLGHDFNQEVRLVSPLGATRWVDFSMRVLFDEDGEIEGFLGTCNDVTERYVNQEKLKHIADFDSLTGLATRLLFQDRLQRAFYDSERDNSIVSIFFLDLDGFKDVNDTLGHDVGDILLQKVADRLMNTLRKNDTVARFGGDEFVVMLGHDEQIAEVVVVANKVIEAVAKPYVIGEQEIYITTSLGIAQGTMPDTTPETLLKNADFALYSAKKEGKNKFQLFNEVLEANSKSRINLMNDMRSGLKRDRFVLHYQPICDVVTGKVSGFEALLRFKDKEDNLVSPLQFIPLLEESNLIAEVGAWAVNEVCYQLAQWKSFGVFPIDGYISFNVSAKQLNNDSLVDTIKQACDKYEVEPSSLVMELTESVIINKQNRVRTILENIQAMGVRLALDDFGTGYSSLSYLQHFSFNIIKIDKSFVDDLSEQGNDVKIVKAIIALASSLELKVIAEGVETKLGRDKIRELGSHYIQGFYISRPLLATKVIDYLAQD
ncbi:EAL domain-containing protein [Glaciecola sp. MH2013]|uniref:sensor domain-containing protein n=1 Tax=Glaciecola sp. MH2013 TaxID=2785524 RepID=UPI00189E03DD|nr:bifunctional diguanylate cyclase/phosphodiesterase [Glaciecola sp. MH2013]MBF7073355.1 EAL domain-containing protein [Glaciecola sp. MH2013]